MRIAIVFISCATLIWGGCSAGQLCDCKPLNDYGAMPDENGTAVNQWLCRQTANAQHDKGTIYQSDWVGNSDRLSPFGRKRLGSWTNLTGVQPNLYIETSGDSSLDSQRQSAVSNYLAQVGLLVQPESIRVANVDSGLAGEEVPPIADRFLGELNGPRDSGSDPFGGFSSSGQSGGFF